MKQIERKVLAALLATCLLAALFPTGALAAGEGYDHNHPACGVECGHDGDHADMSWTAWDPTDPNQKPTKAGYYYFTDDLIASPDGDTEGISWLVPDGASYLCLNGHSVAQFRKSITISTGSTLTICDCQGGGSVGGWDTGTDHGTIEVINGGTLNLYSGTIHANGESQGARCAIYVAGASSVQSKVNLYGGTVQAQNPATNDGAGYAVYLAKFAEAYIYGGSFSASDKGHYSYALFSDSIYCTATVTGGSFTGDGPAAMVGGHNGGTLNISGGTFTSTHNNAVNIQTKGTGNISGGVFIGAPGQDAVYVAGRSSTPPAKATLSGGIYSTQPIADNEEHLVFAEGKSAQIITANDEGYQAAYAGYYIVKEEAPAHSHDGVTFTPWNGTDDVTYMGSTASLYLTKDVTRSDVGFSVPAGKSLHLCLNGFTVSGNIATGLFSVDKGGTLTVCDCSENSTGKIHSGDGFGCVGVYNQGAFILKSGTVEGTAVGVYNGGNHYDCTINGGVVTGRSGIYNQGFGAYAKTFIKGGTITGSNEYGVQNDAAGTELYLSGAPSITGAKADIYTNAASSYIHADDSAQPATPYSGKVLSLGYPSPLTPGNPVVRHATEAIEDKFKLADQDHGLTLDKTNRILIITKSQVVTPPDATLAQWLAENELTVKDVFVTAANAGNILSGDPANDGKVKLELVNGRATLTLDNANIVYEDSWPKIIDLTVYSDNDQYLDIKVVGTVNLVSKPTESWGQGDGISGGSMGGTGGKAHFRIEGGTLNIKNDSSRPGTGLYTSGTLTVAGADTVVNIDSGTDEEWSRPILGKVEDLLKLEDGLAVTDPANGEMVYNYSTKDWYLSDGNRGTAHKLTIKKPGAQPDPIPTYNISGTVTDGEDAAVSGATVKLMQGNTQFGETATTDAEGLFSFDGVKPGVYNIVATKDGVTMTKLVTVTNADLTNQTLTMPDGNVSSVLDVKPNTPDVVVGGLEQEAAANAAGASSVTVTMTVETKEETDADTAPDIAKIKETASGKTLAFLAITVEKQVDDAEAEAIEETANLLTIVIPFDRTGKKDVTVYRCHGDAAEALTTNPNTDGEYFTVSDAAVTVYAKKFSTYAIGYTEAEESPTSLTPSRPSSSTTTRYTVTATAMGGGKLDPDGAVRVSRNSNKTFTITPNEGYEIADVLVDGESVGAVTKYTFEKITKDHTIEASFQKAEIRPAWNPFVDVKSGDWFHDSVKAVYENGLMVGMDSTHFAPALDTSRAMITTVLWRLAGSPDPRETADYTDCNGEAYYAKAVAWATEKNIVEGYGNGKFGPSDPITREQLAAMLYRYAESPAARGTLDGFTDSGMAGSWAIDALRWAVEQGILQGKGGNVLDPTGWATRAEAAAMLQRFCESNQ